LAKLMIASAFTMSTPRKFFPRQQFYCEW